MQWPSAPSRSRAGFPLRGASFGSHLADSAGSKMTPWESSACQHPCASPTFAECLRVTGQQLFLETSFLRIHSPEPPNRLSFVLKTPEVALPRLALYLPQEYCTWLSSGVKPSGGGAPPYRALLGILVSVSCNFSTVRSVLSNVPISPDSHRACQYPCKGSGELDEAEPSRVSFLPGILSLWGCRFSWARWGAGCRAFVEMAVLERF